MTKKRLILGKPNPVFSLFRDFLGHGTGMLKLSRKFVPPVQGPTAREKPLRQAPALAFRDCCPRPCEGKRSHGMLRQRQDACGPQKIRDAARRFRQQRVKAFQAFRGTGARCCLHPAPSLCGAACRYGHENAARGSHGRSGAFRACGNHRESPSMPRQSRLVRPALPAHDRAPSPVSVSLEVRSVPRLSRAALQS